MPKNASTASLRLCQHRASVPGGSQEERERDFMRHEGPYLVRAELQRIRPVDSAPDNLLNRICQAVDVLLGRGHVYVERRHRH